MNEAEYFASQFTDSDLNAQADAGEFFLDEDRLLCDVDSSRDPGNGNKGKALLFKWLAFQKGSRGLRITQMSFKRQLTITYHDLFLT